MRICLFILFLSISSALYSQTTLTIEGQSYTNALDTWDGVTVPHSAQTVFTFRNNSITSVNSFGYMLQAGDEVPAATNNNLDGSSITGNRLTWNGTPGAPLTHGLFLGYNKNDIIEYNYLDKVPYGIVIKSGTDAGVNMSCTSGAVAYNIIKNSGIGIRIKGMNGVLVYNNTFYDNLSASDYFVFISSNDDRTVPAASTGTKIKNNIFYSTHQNYYIYVAPGSESGFECDYNVYYCEAGVPMFNYLGAAKTFAQWQALGFDIHSVVVNPNFVNTTDFVPASRLDNGTNLGTVWQAGLSSTATWTPGVSPESINQNGAWQVGARLYGTTATIPAYVSSVIQNVTPNLLEMTYNQALANVIPSVSAFTVLVNSVNRAIISVSVSGTKVTLTLSTTVLYGDIITVSYLKPAINPLQTASGGQASSISVQPVVNNRTNVNPTVSIIAPGNGSSYTAPSDVTITAVAADADGSVSKVEFYNGSTKIGEKLTSPYSFSWNNVGLGSYILTAVATDNFNAKVTSLPISITVVSGTPVPNIPPVVNITSPANGSLYITPATITITAVASDADGTVSKVEFYNGSTKLGETLISPYSFIWNNVGSGSYIITAIATDNSNAKTTSSPISVTVNNVLPVVSIVSPVTGSKYAAPASIPISVNASDSDGTISKVDFYNGQVKLGEKTSPPYLFTWSGVMAGTYTLSAIATDNANGSTTSNLVVVTVDSISKVNSDLIDLYPNPTTGSFTIDFLNSPQVEGYKILIVNLTGEKIYETVLAKNETTKHFNLSYIDSGIYILLLVSKEILTTKKIIKD